MHDGRKAIRRDSQTGNDLVAPPEVVRASDPIDKNAVRQVAGRLERTGDWKTVHYTADPVRMVVEKADRPIGVHSCRIHRSDCVENVYARPSGADDDEI